MIRTEVVTVALQVPHSRPEPRHGLFNFLADALLVLFGGLKKKRLLPALDGFLDATLRVEDVAYVFKYDRVFAFQTQRTKELDLRFRILLLLII